MGVRPQDGARRGKGNLQGRSKRSHRGRRAHAGKRLGAVTPAFSGGGIKERWKTTPGPPALPAPSAGAFPLSCLGGRWRLITAPRQALPGRSSRPCPGLALSMGTEPPAAGSTAASKPRGGLGGGRGEAKGGAASHCRAGPAPAAVPRL